MMPSGAVTGKTTKLACTVLKITRLGHERENFFLQKSDSCLGAILHCAIQALPRWYARVGPELSTKRTNKTQRTPLDITSVLLFLDREVVHPFRQLLFPLDFLHYIVSVVIFIPYQIHHMATYGHMVKRMCLLTE